MRAPLEVRELPIAELKPAPYNPRRLLKPGSPAHKKLRRGLEEFGLVEPLIWNETTGHVVGGHARLRILAELGAAVVPVSVVRLTATREKALNVLLNNQEAQGRYDPAKLAAVLEELEALPEAALTGFGAGMLRNLRLDAVEPLPAEASIGCVEVLLVFGEAQYEAAESALNAVLREHEIEAHVRRL